MKMKIKKIENVLDLETSLNSRKIKRKRVTNEYPNYIFSIHKNKKYYNQGNIFVVSVVNEMLHLNYKKTKKHPSKHSLILTNPSKTRKHSSKIHKQSNKHSLIQAKHSFIQANSHSSKQTKKHTYKARTRIPIDRNNFS